MTNETVSHITIDDFAKHLASVRWPELNCLLVVLELVSTTTIAAAASLRNGKRSRTQLANPVNSTN